MPKRKQAEPYMSFHESPTEPTKKKIKYSQIEGRCLNVFGTINVSCEKLFILAQKKISKKKRNKKQGGTYFISRQSALIDGVDKFKDTTSFLIYTYKMTNKTELTLLDMRSTFKNDQIKEFRTHRKELSTLFKRANLLQHRKMSEYSIDKLVNVIRTHFNKLDGFIFNDIIDGTMIYKIAMFYPLEKLDFVTRRKYNTVSSSKMILHKPSMKHRAFIHPNQIKEGKNDYHTNYAQSFLK